MLAKGNGCFWEKVPGLPTGHHPPFAVTFQFSVPEGPNGRFSAGNLTVGISRPGQFLPLPLPSDRALKRPEHSDTCLSPNVGATLLIGLACNPFDVTAVLTPSKRLGPPRTTAEDVSGQTAQGLRIENKMQIRCNSKQKNVYLVAIKNAKSAQQRVAR